MPTTLVMLTIRPQRRLIIPRAACLVTRVAPQDRHPRARHGEGLRDGVPDAAASPRDECDFAAQVDLHACPAPSAECGMRNAECTWERREASELSLKFRIPHSAFRISVRPPLGTSPLRPRCPDWSRSRAVRYAAAARPACSPARLR